MNEKEKKFLDYDGLVYLWKKISLQDYPNNETLIAVIESIDETKMNKTDISAISIDEINNIVNPNQN